MDRRNRDEAVQAAHSHFYKFEETARTPGVIPYSEKCFYVQILTLFLKKSNNNNFKTKSKHHFKCEEADI